MPDSGFFRHRVCGSDEIHQVNTPASFPPFFANVSFVALPKKEATKGMLHQGLRAWREERLGRKIKKKDEGLDAALHTLSLNLSS